MQENESYESFITNIFNGSRWGHWICVAAICHNWNVPISIVTPARRSVVHMFHKCENVEIILIVNGWPQTEMELTHFSATQREDENDTRKKNFGTGHMKLIPFRFLDPHEAQKEATSMMIDRQRTILCHQYAETSEEINMMEDKIKTMKNDLKQLKKMRDKIGRNLELLGSEVDHMINKERQRKPSQKTQTNRTTEEIYDVAEAEQAANTLIDTQDEFEQEPEEIPTNIETLTQPTIQENFTIAQTIEVPNDTTGSKPILLTGEQVITEINQQQVITEINQQLEHSDLLAHCIQAAGYAQTGQYITPKLQKRQPTATVSRAPPDDTLPELDDSTVLTDLNEIINEQTSTIVEQPAQFNQPITACDNPSSQIVLQLLQPQKKRRKIHDRSRTSPVPEEEREKNKYYCDTCWRSYTRHYDLEDHKKKRCGKTNEKGENECDTCARHFVKYTSLREHIARVHNNVHPYECTKCAEKFWSNSTFTRHKQTQHPGDVFPKKKW